MIKNYRRLVDTIYNRYLIEKYPELRRAFGINSHLTIAERVCLYKLSKNASRIAEIGSYTGASACCFGAAVRSIGVGKIVCIDTWNNDSMSEGKRDTWDEFHSNTHAYRDFIIPLKGFSNSMAQALPRIITSLDLLFIDGDHSYDGVKADWESYKCFLGEGSTVIFHDYGWADGVKQVVHEDVMPIVFQHDHLPNMWWGQIGGLP